MIDSAVSWKTCLAREVTVLRADLRTVSGVTVELLNRCFATMSEIVFRHRGRIDRFCADSLLIVFECEDSPVDGVRRAVSCAVDMQVAINCLNGLGEAEGLPPVHFGIGVHTGRVMSTLLGADLYAEHAGIGDEVNLESRIESFSRRGQVLISEAAYRRCGGFVQAGAPLDVFVKGRSRLAALREVRGIPSLAKQVPGHDEHAAPRAHAAIPFTYRMVVNGVVVPEPRAGRILDIGDHGVLAEIRLPISSASRLRMGFDLPEVREPLRDLHGKVVKVVRKECATRVGIQFSAMTPRQGAAIQRYVQRLVGS
jgi:adenylate cyclase